MKALCLSLLIVTTLGASAALLESPQTGGLQVQSLSSLSFGPEGLLLVAEPASASVVAIQTGDAGPKTERLAKPVADIGAQIAAGLGAKKEDITIKDLAVNPASGRIYLGVQRRPDHLARTRTRKG